MISSDWPYYFKIHKRERVLSTWGWSPRAWPNGGLYRGNQVFRGKLLKGSTSKEVLEVFYQEVSLRLIAWVSFFVLNSVYPLLIIFGKSILQKHIKRQIISLKGGFLVISDLNEYSSFISSLKVWYDASDYLLLKSLSLDSFNYCGLFYSQNVGSRLRGRRC